MPPGRPSLRKVRLTLERAELFIDTSAKPAYHELVVVLHGELAVPYTRNPP